jgi:hypothetical protein
MKHLNEATMTSFPGKVLCILFSILVVGCGSATPIQFPTEFQLRGSDLPRYFHWQGEEFPRVSGATVSKRDTYSAATGRRDEYLFIKHQITVYPSESIAEDSFSQWRDDWFPTGPQLLPDAIRFDPRDPRDQYMAGCHPATINGNKIDNCVFLQQHTEMIFLLIANVDGNRITHDLLEDILDKLDAQYNSERNAAVRTTREPEIMMRNALRVCWPNAVAGPV